MWRGLIGRLRAWCAPPPRVGVAPAEDATAGLPDVLPAPSILLVSGQRVPVDRAEDTQGRLVLAGGRRYERVGMVNGEGVYRHQ